jgi:DoxX-like family
MTPMSTSTNPAATSTDPDQPSRTASRVGLVISILVGLFLLFDSVTKLLRLPSVVAATVQLGFPAYTVPIMGALLLFSLVLYAIPRTSMFGAVLVTAYLGGAVCANLRAELPLFGFTLFPVYTGVLVWLGLYLRSAALRRLVRAGY